MPPSPPAGSHRGMELLIAFRWPLAVFLSTVTASSIVGWVIATDDEFMVMGPITVKLVVERALPISAEVKSIQSPVELKPLQASVSIPGNLSLASPLNVSVPQLKQPLQTKVEGSVEAAVSGSVKSEVSGEVTTGVQGPVEVDIPKPVKHERIRLGIFGL